MAVNDDEVLRSLLAEKSKLELLLRKTAEFRRLEAINTSINMISASIIDMMRETRARRAGKSRPPTVRPPTINRQILQIAETAIRETGQRLNSRQVMELVIQRGITFPRTANVQSTISGALSHSDIFVSGHDDRGSGYGLREWTEKP